VDILLQWEEAQEIIPPPWPDQREATKEINTIVIRLATENIFLSTH
jgi:hypothetical protein